MRRSPTTTIRIITATIDLREDIFQSRIAPTIQGISRERKEGCSLVTAIQHITPTREITLVRMVMRRRRISNDPREMGMNSSRNNDQEIHTTSDHTIRRAHLPNQRKISWRSGRREKRRSSNSGT
jgi:hypothetical protein